MYLLNYTCEWYVVVFIIKFYYKIVIGYAQFYPDLAINNMILFIISCQKKRVTN